MKITWHADDDLLARYVRGDAGALQGASVEQHLIHCSTAGPGSRVTSTRRSWTRCGRGSRIRSRRQRRACWNGC